MRKILLILTIFVSTSANAEPWDKLVNQLTSTQTLTDLKSAKEQFYSRHDRTPLTRTLNFEYKFTVWEFDFIYGNYSTDFQLYVVTKNDSIIFGRLERLHWRGRTRKVHKFSINESQLQNLVKQHNVFYSSSYSVNRFINELTEDSYFSLGCGETASNKPMEAKRMLRWAKSRNVKKLSNWLKSPNYELQAYAIEGLTRIKEKDVSIPEDLNEII